MNIYVINKSLKRILLYFLIAIMLLFYLFPFYWIVLTSIQEGGSLYKKNTDFIPRNFTLDNFILVIKGEKTGEEVGVYSKSILIFLKNSLLVATVSTIVCIILGILGAYAFARLKFKGSNTAFIAIIITEMLPPVALLIPFYLFFKRLNLINNLGGLAIIHISWLLPITTWILYSYFKTIPSDLEDAARVDGATRVGTIFKVFIPVSWPGIVSSGIICFIFSMGEFMSALTIINKGDVHTLPLALTQFILKGGYKWENMAASAVITIIVPVFLVIFFQRFIIRGLTAGAVKE